MAVKHYRKCTCLLVFSVAMVIVLLNSSYDLFGSLVCSEEERLLHQVMRNLITSSHQYGRPDNLPQEVIDGVEKFVFFIGYPRSGHSIVGSLLDAHPHMVIAHEFKLFKKLANDMSHHSSQQLLQSKQQLFNALYKASVRDSTVGVRTEHRDAKNYTLSLDSPWLGRYDGYVSVVGEKTGGITASTFSESPEKFKEIYETLERTVGVPIKAFHCVRNPYDMVATGAMYELSRKKHDPRFVSAFKSNMSKLQDAEFDKARFDNEKVLERYVNVIDKLASAVVETTELMGSDNVLELHNSDLVDDPWAALTKICSFLDIECPPDYLKSCSDKVFKSVSKSRELVVWPQTLRNEMEAMMDRYQFFHRYSFESQ